MHLKQEISTKGDMWPISQRFSAETKPNFPKARIANCRPSLEKNRDSLAATVGWHTQYQTAHIWPE